ncbi:MAG: preprotein translocase subunit SecE [Thermotogae bacterium]|nr:MAG: preprotein translocase subunit SecE [Thermotogota bacterium]
MPGRIRKFLSEVRSESKKVTWPNKKELLAATSVVLFILLVMGIYLGFLDLAFSNLTRWLLAALGIG